MYHLAIKTICRGVQDPPSSSPQLLGNGHQAPLGLVSDVRALTHYMWLMQMATLGAAICISLAMGNGACVGRPRMHTLPNFL